MTGETSDHNWPGRVAPVERSSAEAQRTYDRLAPWYDLVEAPFERRACSAGLRLLDAQPGESILEIGYGTGHTLRALAISTAPRGVLLGVDLSWQMARIARRRLARQPAPPTPLVTQADARHLPVRHGAFDAVTMSFFLELLPTGDIPVVLAECRLALHPGGRLVVVSLDLPQRPTLMNRAYLAAHRRFPRLVDCRPLPLQEVLMSNGFVVTDAWRSTVVGISIAAVRANRG